MGRIVLFLENPNPISIPPHPSGSSLKKNTRNSALEDYIHRINNKLKRTFYIERGEKWHVIYYNLDVFVELGTRSCDSHDVWGWGAL